MTTDQLTTWDLASLWPVATGAGLVLLALTATGYLMCRRVGGAVMSAGLGAIVCTAYSGDTSWGFARDRLGMASHHERLIMFAAGEVALFVCGIMARANKKATATDGEAGTPGVPGVLVWVIAGVQVVPAFTESGFWAGLVRAFFGPIMAALLWHLAMGLEIRVRRPDALSTGLPAQIAQELRSRLLSYLGLAVRGRTAAQITRDRATARAVRLASRRWLGPWGRAALKSSVAKAQAGTSGAQRHQLLQMLAARRSASLLRTIDVVSPWTVEAVQEPRPTTPLGVAGEELRRMHPVDAICAIGAAHPGATPAELASLAIEYGVPTTETGVQIALRARYGHPDAQPLAAAEEPRALAPAGEDFDTAAAAAIAVAQQTPDAQPLPEPEPEHTHEAASDAQPQPEAHPDADDAQPRSAPARRTSAAAKTAARRSTVTVRVMEADAEFLPAARALNLRALRLHGQQASLRFLQSELGVGQPRAQRLQKKLPATLDAALAAEQDQTKES